MREKLRGPSPARRRRSPSEMTPSEAARPVDDRRDAHHLARHLVDRLGHRRVASTRGGPALPCASGPGPSGTGVRACLRDGERRSPPPEAALLRDRHRQGVAEGEHGRRRGGRREVQGAGLARDRDGERHVRDARRRTNPGVPVMRDRPDRPRRARTRAGARPPAVSPECDRASSDVARHEHSEVAVAGLRRRGGSRRACRSRRGSRRSSGRPARTCRGRVTQSRPLVLCTASIARRNSGPRLPICRGRRRPRSGGPRGLCRATWVRVS